MSSLDGAVLSDHCEYLESAALHRAHDSVQPRGLPREPATPLISLAGEPERTADKIRELEGQLTAASRASQTQAELAGLKAQQQQATCEALELNIQQHRDRVAKLESEAAQAGQQATAANQAKIEMHEEVQRLQKHASAADDQVRERETTLGRQLEVRSAASSVDHHGLRDARLRTRVRWPYAQSEAAPVQAAQQEAARARQEADDASRATDSARADVASLRHELAVERQLTKEVGDALEQCRGSSAAS